jgi:chromobox protein 1
VEEYHERVGGAPVPPSSAASSKRKSAGKSSTPVKSGTKRSSSALYDDAPLGSQATKRRNLNGSGTPKLPEGSWEGLIERVHTVLEEYDDSSKAPKTKNGKVLLGLIEWKDGRKTQHPLAALRRRCPQKMLDYYEQHL